MGASRAAMLVAVLATACRPQSRNSDAGPPVASVITSTSAATSPPPSPVATVDAVELVRQYLDNPVRADAAYENKRVRVTGKITQITSVKKDAFIAETTYSVALGNEAPSAVSAPWVACSFSEKHASEVAALARGQGITVDCTCKGMHVDIVSAVNMADCEFVALQAGPNVMEVCHRLEAAGVGAHCQLGAEGGTDTGYFEIPSVPNRAGAGVVMYEGSDARFGFMVGSLSNDKKNLVLLSNSAHVIVMLTPRQAISADVQARAKAVVDTLTPAPQQPR